MLSLRAPVLVLLACFLVGASAYDYTSYYKYNPQYKRYNQPYKYYAAYWYYNADYYPPQPQKYFAYYCKNFHDNCKEWYPESKGMVGYSYGYDRKYNPGYKYSDKSWGGVAYFYTYSDAYNWAYNKDYGFLSGYYNNNPEYEYDKYFKNTVFGKDKDAGDFKILGGESLPADIQNVF